MLALVVVGSYLQQKASSKDFLDPPSAWKYVADALGFILSRNSTPDHMTTVFGAIELVLQGNGSVVEARRNAFLALEVLRSGVPLPLSLLQLAVQQYTGVARTRAQVWALLREIRHMGLVEYFTDDCHYELLPLVEMYLDEYCIYTGGGSSTSTGCSSGNLRKAARMASGCSTTPMVGSSQQPSTPASLQLFSQGASSRVLSLFLIHFGKEAVLQAARSLLQDDPIVKGGPASIWGGCSLSYCEPSDLCAWVQQAEKEYMDKNPSDATTILRIVLDRTQTDFPPTLQEKIYDDPTPSQHRDPKSDSLPGEGEEPDWVSSTGGGEEEASSSDEALEALSAGKRQPAFSRPRSNSWVNHAWPGQCGSDHGRQRSQSSAHPPTRNTSHMSRQGTGHVRGRGTSGGRGRGRGPGGNNSGRMPRNRRR